MVYTISISEARYGNVEIHADSEEEAKKVAECLYHHGRIDWKDSDLVSVNLEDVS